MQQIKPITLCLNEENVYYIGSDSEDEERCNSGDGIDSSRDGPRIDDCFQQPQTKWLEVRQLEIDTLDGPVLLNLVEATAPKAIFVEVQLDDVRESKLAAAASEDFRTAHQPKMKEKEIQQELDKLPAHLLRATQAAAPQSSAAAAKCSMAEPPTAQAHKQNRSVEKPSQFLSVAGRDGTACSSTFISISDDDDKRAESKTSQEATDDTGEKNWAFEEAPDMRDDSNLQLTYPLWLWAEEKHPGWLWAGSVDPEAIQGLHTSISDSDEDKPADVPGTNLEKVALSAAGHHQPESIDMDDDLDDMSMEESERGSREGAYVTPSNLTSGGVPLNFNIDTDGDPPQSQTASGGDFFFDIRIDDHLDDASGVKTANTEDPCPLQIMDIDEQLLQAPAAQPEVAEPDAGRSDEEDDSDEEADAEAFDFVDCFIEDFCAKTPLEVPSGSMHESAEDANTQLELAEDAIAGLSALDRFKIFMPRRSATKPTPMAARALGIADDEHPKLYSRDGNSKLLEHSSDGRSGQSTHSQMAADSATDGRNGKSAETHTAGDSFEQASNGKSHDCWRHGGAAATASDSTSRTEASNHYDKLSVRALKKEIARRGLTIPRGVIEKFEFVVLLLEADAAHSKRNGGTRFPDISDGTSGPHMAAGAAAVTSGSRNGKLADTKIAGVVGTAATAPDGRNGRPSDSRTAGGSAAAASLSRDEAKGEEKATPQTLHGEAACQTAEKSAAADVAAIFNAAHLEQDANMRFALVQGEVKKAQQLNAFRKATKGHTSATDVLWS